MSPGSVAPLVGGQARWAQPGVLPGSPTRVVPPAQPAQLRPASGFGGARLAGFAGTPQRMTAEVLAAVPSMAAPSMDFDAGSTTSTYAAGTRSPPRGPAAQALASPAGADDPEVPRQPFRSLPPFYWVPSVETVGEFEVSGAYGEIVAKVHDYGDGGSALPITGTLRMAKGALYLWTLQIVRQAAHRPQVQFGIHGTAHARPWRLVASGRCSRSRDDGPWLARPAGDIAVGEGDYIHCEANLQGLEGPLGSFAFAVNDGPFETVFEDIPLSDGFLHPVVLMGGAGTTIRLCST